MAKSRASAQWNGSLEEGRGTTNLETSGAATFDVTWKARTEPGAGMTNPEELIAAAHAACFSMALSHELAGAGFSAETVNTSAQVSFTPGKGITEISLTTRAQVPEISEEQFADVAEAARTGCPVS